MLSYHGGARVRYGYYWNRTKWEIATIPREGGSLPGGPGERYLRTPIALLLLLAPVMGGLYVVFLPFIGFFMILRLTGGKAVAALRRSLAEVQAALSPAWRPGEVYFAGKKETPAETERAPGTPAEPEPLEALAREIERGRKTEA